jgi:di/tricarboxylate transporter
MTGAQIEIFAILGIAMALFLWGRWRYDIVAFAALMAAVVGGVVAPNAAFTGFGHPAVITVAAVLIISRALSISGLIDGIAAWLARTAKTQFSQLGVLSGIAMALSGFMNNVGALALLLPLAIRTVEKPSAILMPLSFASILGGLVTLIGTPPNIIVATFRAETAGDAFALFDFAPVGLPVALVGIAFLLIVGWQLIPAGRAGRRSGEDLFEVGDYITEVRLTDKSPYVGKFANELEELFEEHGIIVCIVRDGHRRLSRIRTETLQAGDILLLRADPTSLDKAIKDAGLELVADVELSDENLRSDEVGLVEAVVPPGSRLEGRTLRALRLRRQYGVAVVALARAGERITGRIAGTHLRAGDVLLLQGESETLPDNIAALGLLPLAERGLSIGRTGRAWQPLAVFAAAVAATAVGLVPVHIAFGVAIVALIGLGRITPREAYEAIDWPVIVLLGAMIPLGSALQTTGGTDLVAQSIVGLAADLPAWAVLGVLLVVTMTLSDLMNNAATAIVMAPIGVAIAGQLGVNADPFLMAVALGASCAFLTPIGHQNNVLVMGPGGYRFGDYWRVGLPLEALIVALGLPLILIFWPL